jgi:putative adhesin
MFVITAALLATLVTPPAAFPTSLTLPDDHVSEGGQAGQGSQGPSRRNRQPDTDQTVPVSKGARLSVNSFGGEVQVRGWDKDAVRVQAYHNTRTRITIRHSTPGVSVTSSGMPSAVDYDISVPAWMPVKVEGTYIYIAVEGTQADISAETVRGDIVVKGGAAVVTAKSVEGEVILENVRGKVSASSINQGVTVNGAAGELTAETVNGHIALNNIDSTSVEVASVNGNIRYDGSAPANGRYRFSTHNGNISVGVPENASAAFMVRTYNGNVRTDLQVQGGGEVRRGQRTTYTLGSGSAEFDLESFGGTIQLRRRGSEAPLKPRPKEKDQ